MNTNNLAFSARTKILASSNCFRPPAFQSSNKAWRKKIADYYSKTSRMIIQEKNYLLKAWSEKKIDGDTKIAAELAQLTESCLQSGRFQVQSDTILGDLKGSAFPCKGLDLYVALILT